MTTEDSVENTNFGFGVEFDVDNSVPVTAFKKISEEDINNFITGQKAKATVYRPRNLGLTIGPLPRRFPYLLTA